MASDRFENFKRRQDAELGIKNSSDTDDFVISREAKASPDAVLERNFTQYSPEKDELVTGAGEAKDYPPAVMPTKKFMFVPYKEDKEVPEDAGTSDIDTPDDKAADDTAADDTAVTAQEEKADDEPIKVDPANVPPEVIKSASGVDVIDPSDEPEEEEAPAETAVEKDAVGETATADVPETPGEKGRREWRMTFEIVPVPQEEPKDIDSVMEDVNGLINEAGEIIEQNTDPIDRLSGIERGAISAVAKGAAYATAAAKMLRKFIKDL